MIPRKYFFLASLILMLATSANAAVTLQFSQTNVARATGFGDRNGVATNGMNWGVVISTTNGTFSPGGYDVFDRAISGFLSINGVLTDDYYVAQTLTTSNQLPTSDDPGGDGGITAIANVPFGAGTNITQGDQFALIWFDSTPAVGSYYGFMANGLFQIPQDGLIGSFASSVFGGPTADPVKSASYQFGIVPEPSRVLLVLIAFCGFAFKRRR